MKRSHVALVGLLGAAACTPGQNACSTVTQSQRANVDRVADAVLVTQPGANGHTFLVTTNPEIQHLRILDLTAALFVQSPNKYFPASVPVGPETRRIAKAPNDESRVFALDSADAQVFEVNTQGFTLVGQPIQTNAGPADLTAFHNDDGSTQLFVTIPDAQQIQVLTLNDGNPPPSVVSLRDKDSAPGDIDIDPFGDTLVVTDSNSTKVHVIDRASIAAHPDSPDVIDVDVGGPTSAVAIGVIDVGDGDAPVAVVLRSDENIAVALRLFRPGFREPRVAVLGSVELPSFPITAYVPDNRTSETICCRDLPDTAVAAREATSAWAAVATADGRVTYLRLAPPVTADQSRVRLFDKDTATLSLGATSDADWSPQAGDDNRRPIPTLKPSTSFGDPPFVPFLSTTEKLDLIWEGPPPGLEAVGGSLAGATFTTTADVAARGARVGDVAVLQPATRPTQCTSTDQFPQTGTIASIAPAAGSAGGFDVTITPDSSEQFARCTTGGGAVTLTVGVAIPTPPGQPQQGEFAVFRGNGDFLGRLSFAGGPDPVVALPGAFELTVAPSSAGPPQVRGSQLQVPIDPHVVPVQLPLSDPPVQVQIGGGGFGSAGYLPVVMTGGEMNVPAVIAGAVNAGVNGVGNVQQQNGPIIRARRMQIGTGSEDFNGLNAVFSCDEGESIADFCDVFR